MENAYTNDSFVNCSSYSDCDVCTIFFLFLCSLLTADPNTANLVFIMKILHNTQYSIHEDIYAVVFYFSCFDCVLDDPLTHR